MIGGTGNLTQLGCGTLVLTGANTYGGATTVSSGTLQVGSRRRGGEHPRQRHRQRHAGLQPLRRRSPTRGAIGGTGGLTQLGTGTLVLTGASTYGGPTTVSAGTLQIGSGGTSGSITSNVNLSAGATLAFNRSDSYSYGNVISGSGTVSQSGSGTLTLGGSNSYSGGTTVTAGTLLLGNLTALGAATAGVTLTAGTLDLGGYSPTIGALGGNSARHDLPGRRHADHRPGRRQFLLRRHDQRHRRTGD